MKEDSRALSKTTGKKKIKKRTPAPPLLPDPPLFSITRKENAQLKKSLGALQDDSSRASRGWAEVPNACPRFPRPVPPSLPALPRLWPCPGLAAPLRASPTAPGAGKAGLSERGCSGASSGDAAGAGPGWAGLGRAGRDDKRLRERQHRLPARAAPAGRRCRARRAGAG